MEIIIRLNVKSKRSYTQWWSRILEVIILVIKLNFSSCGIALSSTLLWSYYRLHLKLILDGIEETQSLSLEGLLGMLEKYFLSFIASHSLRTSLNNYYVDLKLFQKHNYCGNLKLFLELPFYTYCEDLKPFLEHP